MSDKVSEYPDRELYKLFFPINQILNILNDFLHLSLDSISDLEKALKKATEIEKKNIHIQFNIIEQRRNTLLSLQNFVKKFHLNDKDDTISIKEYMSIWANVVQQHIQVFPDLNERFS